MTIATLDPRLAASFTARGYTDLTPVQAAVLEPALDGRDLLVSARTGSGKTVGFGLLIGQSLLATPDEPGSPRALVIAPTRDLALQVQRELFTLLQPVGLAVAAVVGGMAYNDQIRAIRKGSAVIVGTPGRLCDLVDKGVLDLSALSVVVLDEADEMLDMGFKEELEALLDASPSERRTLMFSATLPAEALRLAQQYQRLAARVAVDVAEAHADITWRAVTVRPTEREGALVNLLRLIDAPASVVFVGTREGVVHLHARLVERGFEAVALSGELSQAERTRALKSLRDGRVRVLVATDVAARGLDLPALDLVVHYDLPHDSQVLVHRSGRTGRAGRKGLAVLLCPPMKRRKALQMLQMARIDANWSGPPTAAEVMAADQSRLLAELAPEGEPSPEDLDVARKLLEAHSAEALVANFVRERRAARPSPDVMEPPPREEGPPPDDETGVWFRVNVGRERRADPRWLVPMICRRGNITRAKIGRIRIYPRESRFLVAGEVADAFEAAALRPDPREPQVRFLRAEDQRER
jgi:ATP-dependent RNA helicase DeaD